jgi:geranyl diphosphate synthase
VPQLTADADEAASMDHYLRKTYCKTASLMANSCKAVAVLGGHSQADCHAASEYGRHVGLAFQLVDDIMDFTCTGEPLAQWMVLWRLEAVVHVVPLVDT